MIPVVIPHYKHKKRLRRALKCLKAQFLPDDELKVHVVKDSGTGYTPAVNRGLRHFLAQPSQWDYIVIMDQDMYLDPDAIGSMKKTLEKHKNCGIAVCLQQLYDTPSFVHAGGMDCIPAGTLQTGHMSYFFDDHPIWWGDIACCMIRKECMWDIGLLDENFVFVCSDSDYTLTARSKGWEVWMSGMARGIHEKGESAHESVKAKKHKDHKRPDWLYKQMGRDQALFRAKWEKSDYYKLLKYQKGKIITTLRGGKVIKQNGSEINLLQKKIDQAKTQVVIEQGNKQYVVSK
jgi:GT2 family glycosyltransferase